MVSGTVEGRIYNFSQSLDLDGQLGHSLYGFAQSLRVDDRGQWATVSWLPPATSASRAR